MSQMHQMTLKQLQRAYGRYNLSMGFYLVQIRPVVHWIRLILTKMQILHILTLTSVTLIKVKGQVTISRQCPQDTYILL